MRKFAIVKDNKVSRVVVTHDESRIELKDGESFQHTEDRVRLGEPRAKAPSIKGKLLRVLIPLVGACALVGGAYLFFR